MAFTKQDWEKAKGYYEAGLSLAKIKDKTGIARNTISQRAKREQWEQGKNTDYIEAKENVAVGKGNILEQSGTVALEIADDIARDNIRRKNLVYGLTEKALAKIDKSLSKTIPLKNHKGEDTGEVEEWEYTAKDMKEYVEAIDKASITLNVNPRHAQSQVQVNNQNQQNNTKKEITYKVVN